MLIENHTGKKLETSQVIKLYEANKWSAAKKPELLIKSLENAHSLITAWDGTTLIGLGNAISDGYLVVYYPHLIVHPDYQHRGVGRKIVEKLQEIYHGFHQQMLVADGKAIDFYQKCGFEVAGNTKAMWIYLGDDH